MPASARCRFLAAVIVSLTRRSRCPGSATLVGSSTVMAETWLPKVPICSRVRTDTGMTPSSGSVGSSPRSSSQERSPAAHRATTTSLTVQPKVFLIVLTSSRGSDPNATRRCADTPVWNGVWGATRSMPAATGRVARGGHEPLDLSAAAGDHLHPGQVADRRYVVEVRQRGRHWRATPGSGGATSRPRRGPASPPRRGSAQPGRRVLAPAPDRSRRRRAGRASPRRPKPRPPRRDASSSAPPPRRLADRGSHTSPTAGAPGPGAASDQVGHLLGQLALSRPATASATSRTWYSTSNSAFVDPVRMVEAERHTGQSPPQRGQQVHALGHQLANQRRIERPARCGDGVIHPQRAHVTVGAVVFGGQEQGIECLSVVACVSPMSKPKLRQPEWVNPRGDLGIH